MANSRFVTTSTLLMLLLLCVKIHPELKIVKFNAMNRKLVSMRGRSGHAPAGHNAVQLTTTVIIIHVLFLSMPLTPE